jgi:hypothetical protein
VVNGGEWSFREKRNSIKFIQELADPGSGYSYSYRKVVRLEKEKPVMVIEHSLKNTGQRAIQSTVYNHNFVALDKQTPGPDFTFRVPYQIQATQLPKKELAEVRGNQVVYLKQLSGEDEVVVIFQGFSDNVKDTEIIIENNKVGAGVKITGDRPLTRNILWSIRSVLAIEPYLSIDIQPGNEFTWKNFFEYYTLPAGN